MKHDTLRFLVSVKPSMHDFMPEGSADLQRINDGTGGGGNGKPRLSSLNEKKKPFIKKCYGNKNNL